MTILILISLEVAQKQVTWFFWEISSWYLMILMILISLRTWEFRSWFLEEIKWLEFFATSRVIRTRILRKSVPVSLKVLAVFAVFFFCLAKIKKGKKKACGIYRFGAAWVEISFFYFFFCHFSLYFYLHHRRWWRKLEKSSRHHCRAKK